MIGHSATLCLSPLTADTEREYLAFPWVKFVRDLLTLSENMGNSTRLGPEINANGKNTVGSFRLFDLKAKQGIRDFIPFIT